MRLLKIRISWLSILKLYTSKKMRFVQLTFIVMLISLSQLFAGMSYNGFSPVISQQQQKTITGNVTDRSGDPLPGVAVTVVGTTIGTLTDADGNFSLTIPDDAEMLSFTFVGMNTQQVPINNQTVFNIIMEESVTDLGDIVVIGYGTAQKQDLTGSIANIDHTEIEKLPISTIDQKLIGQSSGVQIQQASGAPGAGTLVKIRGSGSLGAGNEPLYVVDGVPYSSGSNIFFNPLIYINPNDIESISILKDASSTAIYGSRGANGVILITTKQGEFNKTEINFSAMRGIQVVPEKGRPDMMNAKEFAEYQQDIINKRVRDLENREPTLDDYPVEYRYPDELGEGTDYYDLALRHAVVEEYNLNMSTGTEVSRINLSLGYFNQDGVMKYTGLKRYTGKLNLESRIRKVVRIGASLMPTYINQDRTSTNQGRMDIVCKTLWANPTVSPYDEKGNLKPFIQSPHNKYSQPWSIDNPLFTLRETIANQENFRNFGSVFIEWEIIPNLKAKTNLQTIWSNSNYFQYVPSTVGGKNKPPRPGNGKSYTNKYNSFYWVSENTLTYDKKFNNHSFNAILGYTVEENKTKGINLRAYPYPNDLIESINAAQSISKWGESYNDWSLISYLGRINYSYKNKYLFTGTFRSDGSSRFGSENRWAFFPSLATAWRISNEEFMSNITFIQEMKLRLSYGKSGNNNIGNYRALSSVYAGQYVFGNTQVGTFTLGISNPLLTWEESNQIDAGLELGLFKNRLYLVIDFYNRQSYNMLLNDKIPAITGFNTQTVNQGNIRNRGVEFELNGTPLSGTFSWGIKMNAAFNRNKVIALNEKGDRILSGNNWGFPTHVTYVGKPMTQFFGFELLGLLTAEDMANPDVPKDNLAHEGGNKYKDINGDGQITDILDYTIIGNPWPDAIYGLTNTFSYKNFNLSIIMNGQIGGQVMDSRRTETDFMWGKTNSRREWLNRWISPEQPGDGMHSGVCTGSENWTWKVNTIWVEDATFLRISNLTLSYSLPADWIKYTRVINNCNIYFTIQNLAMFTTYRGANPEGQSAAVSSNLAPGWDSSPYPLSRVTSVGLNLSF